MLHHPYNHPTADWQLCIWRGIHRIRVGHLHISGVSEVTEWPFSCSEVFGNCSFKYTHTCIYFLYKPNTYFERNRYKCRYSKALQLSCFPTKYFLFIASGKTSPKGKLQLPRPPLVKARLCKHYSRNMKRSDDSEREKRRKVSLVVFSQFTEHYMKLCNLKKLFWTFQTGVACLITLSRRQCKLPYPSHGRVSPCFLFIHFLLFYFI